MIKPSEKSKPIKDTRLSLQRICARLFTMAAEEKVITGSLRCSEPPVIRRWDSSRSLRRRRIISDESRAGTATDKPQVRASSRSISQCCQSQGSKSSQRREADRMISKNQMKLRIPVVSQCSYFNLQVQTNWQISQGSTSKSSHRGSRDRGRRS